MQQRNKLLEGWISTELSVAGEWSTGGTPSRNKKEFYGGIIPWIKIADLNDGIITETTEYITDMGLKSSSAKLLPKGALCVAIYGSIGKLGILGVPASTNQACGNCIVNEDLIIRKFLFYYIFSQRKALLAKGRGGNQANISNKILREWPLPLPPLAEQQRIVSAIESFFTRLDETNEKLEKVLIILKKSRKSVLTSACNGKLTENWRNKNPDVESVDKLIESIIHEKNMKLKEKKASEASLNIHPDESILQNIPESWSVISLDEISTKITDGTHHSPPNGPEGEFKYITAKNIKNDGIDLKNITFVSSEIHNEIYSRCNPEYGDLLLIKDGATTGIATLNNLTEPFSMLSSVALLKFPESILNKYIMYYIRSPIFQSNVLNKMGGAAITRLTLQKISEMVVALPPYPEQLEIVRRVDALFAYADNVEAKVAAALEKTEKLRQSILAKAFSGELVPTEAELARREGRGYEPADVLLERIKGKGKIRER